MESLTKIFAIGWWTCLQCTASSDWFFGGKEQPIRADSYVNALTRHARLYAITVMSEVI